MTPVRTMIAAIAGVLILAVGWLSYEWNSSRQELASGPYGVPFELLDQSGAPITEAAFRGRPTAVFFGFTHCPEICPTTLFELDGWLKVADPEGGNIGAYFVTVDPERDTPQILGDYVSAVTDRITGITGDPEKIGNVIKGFNIYAKKQPLDAANPEGDYTMDHTASVLLLDKDGRFRGTIAWGENPDTAVEKLKNLLKG